MSRYYQGFFSPTNPGKYVGDLAKIVYRSGWELKLMFWLDKNPSILKWTSEEIVIPYISPVDGRQHRYFIDFGALVKDSKGQERKVIIEVKPSSQTKPPKFPGKQTKKYLTEAQTYVVNQAKWKAAEAWAEQNNFTFIIADEYTLGIKKR